MKFLFNKLFFTSIKNKYIINSIEKKIKNDDVGFQNNFTGIQKNLKTEISNEQTILNMI